MRKITWARETTVPVCDSCPWRISNHRRKHPAKWYTIGNLRRLWDGLRTGAAPGMVCHASDPESRGYGSEKVVPATSQSRWCGGAVLLVIQHMAELNATGKFSDYTARHQKPITKRGLAKLVERQIFGGGFPSVTIDDPSKVGLPWEDRKVKPCSTST